MTKKKSSRKRLLNVFSGRMGDAVESEGARSLRGSFQNSSEGSNEHLPVPKRRRIQDTSAMRPVPMRAVGKRLPSGKKNRHRDNNMVVPNGQVSQVLCSVGKRSRLEQDDISAAGAVISSNETVRDKSESKEPGGSASDDPRTPRTLFIGNVPVGTKAQTLKRLASAHGNVESVRFRGVVPEGPGIPKRAAYLSGRLHKSVDTLTAYMVFADPGGEEAAGKACAALNMSMLKGNHLRVTMAACKESCPRSSVFVGNLPFDISEEALLNAFQKIMEGSESKIVAARVVRDKETGIGRGFGFVSFDDQLGVRFCMNQKDRILVAGRPVRLDTADKGKLSNSKTAKKYRKRGKSSKFYKKRQSKST